MDQLNLILVTLNLQKLKKTQFSIQRVKLLNNPLKQTKKSDANSAAEETVKEEIIKDDPVCEEWEWEDEEENEYEFLELEDEKYKVETFDGSFSICLNS